MSAGQNKTVVKPDLRALMQIVKEDALFSMNCHAVATVQSFDAESQTVTATMNYKQTTTQGAPLSTPIPVDYPILVDCPIISLHGGLGRLTFPITQGDECMIFFNDRDINAWFSTGQVKLPESSRLHSFSDAIALVGIRSMLKALSDYDEERVVLAMDQTAVKLGAKVQIENATKDLKGVFESVTGLISTMSTDLTTFGTGLTPVTVAAKGAALVAAMAALSAQITLTETTEIGGLLGDS